MSFLEGVGQTSNFGMIGTEDLGSGLAAIFRLESKINLANGAGGAAVNSGAYRTSTTGLFSRAAYVGLKSNSVGTLTLGRNYTPAILAVYNVNAIPVGINTGIGTNMAPQGLGNDFWNSNQIRYDSPEFGGFSMMVNYTFSPDPNAENSNRGRNWGGSITYRRSGLKLTAGHQQDNDVASDHSLNWSVITAAYTYRHLELTAGYDRVKNPWRIAGWVDSRLWTLGAAYTLQPDLILASQYFNVRDTNAGSTSSQWVLNCRYALSKSTALYITATRTNNRAIAIMPLYNTEGTAYASATSVAIGMQHNF
ncbi:porin [Burkholderia multivorans]|uniref:porin n=1 Tax=Burkholderia multivorans TaxID=87883 RepID=UPI001C2367B3|nr:porin [Burkholderia multivorans]MBU9457560.1 porin [Burkholderia multivorans]